MKFAAVLLSTGAVMASPRPKFATDYSTVETFVNEIYQGQYINDPTLGLCCGQSSSCQVQTGFQKGQRYTSYSTNFSRFDDFGDGSVTILDYKARMEVFAVSASNLTCNTYCPLIGGMEPYYLPDEAEDKGTFTIDGHTLQLWQYREVGPLNITMQTNNVFVNQTDINNANPYLEYDHLTPFKQDLGASNETYSNWISGAPDPALFKWLHPQYGKCPIDPNQCQNADAMFRRLRARDFVGFRHILQHLLKNGDPTAKQLLRSLRRRRGSRAAKMAATIATDASPASAKGDTPPTFPQDFFSNEQNFLVLPQGQYSTNDVSGSLYWCCGPDSNCKIQTEYEAGPTYVSFSTQQMRLGNPGDAQAEVIDYNADVFKQLLVDENNTCTSYCPCQQGDALIPLAVDPSATKIGVATIGGKQYDQWQWSDHLGKRIKMDTINAFIDTSGAQPQPFLWAEDITPFNQYLATANTTYDSFKPGTPDPSMFKVNGISSCPLNQNCQQ